MRALWLTPSDPFVRSMPELGSGTRSRVLLMFREQVCVLLSMSISAASAESTAGP
jgi:hypothetical protein